MILVKKNPVFSIIFWKFFSALFSFFDAGNELPDPKLVQFDVKIIKIGPKLPKLHKNGPKTSYFCTFGRKTSDATNRSVCHWCFLYLHIPRKMFILVQDTRNRPNMSILNFWSWVVNIFMYIKFCFFQKSKFLLNFGGQKRQVRVIFLVWNFMNLLSRYTRRVWYP